MRGYQLIPYTLPSVTFAAGTRTNQPLRDIPKQLYGKLCHVVKLVFDVVLTPTFTTAPTVIGHNNIFSACDIWDGGMMRFQGGFNHMRAKEMLSAGKIRIPDADQDPASAAARYFRRVWHAGPPQFAGSPTDFMIPAGLLENGEIRYTHGALTDISADTTAATATVTVTAYLALLDGELRIPPAYQFVNQSLNSTDTMLPGRALYESVALLDSSTFTAWTAGDLASLRFDLGQGDIVPTVPTSAQLAAFLDDFATGQTDAVMGEPAAANDDNAKIVNRASPTAVAAASAFLQPVFWSGPESRISKLSLAESVARLRWTGTQTSGVALVGKILPQPPSVITAAIGKALGRLGLQPAQGGVSVKTLSKRPYVGPFKEFMPWSIKVA